MIKFPDGTPQIIVDAIKIASTCQFVEFTTNLTYSNENKCYIIDAVIGPSEINLFDEDEKCYLVRFIIYNEFPNIKVETIPLKPKLRWFPHQLGDWEELNERKNIICPPELNQREINELLIPYIKHAYKWIKDALNDNLTNSRQMFEIPHYNLKQDDLLVEGCTRIHRWIKINQFGFTHISKYNNLLIATKFVSDFMCRESTTCFNNSKLAFVIPWVLVGSSVFSPPHKPYIYWDDFNDDILTLIIRAIFKTNPLYLCAGLLLAFEVPKNWEGFPNKIVWFVTYFKESDYDKITEIYIYKKKGVKVNILRYFRFLFKNKRLNLKQCIDISSETITCRAFNESDKTNKYNIGIIGVGAIGSCIAKSISKMNFKKIILVDDDKVEIGNLIRHEAYKNHIGLYKTEAIAKILNEDIINRVIEPKIKSIIKNENFLDTADIIIDSTGNSFVHHYIENTKSLRNKIQIYLYIKPGPDYGVIFIKKPNEKNIDFPAAEKILFEDLNSEIQKKLIENSEEGLIYPEPGCYHPTFKASYHRVRMMSDTFATIINDYINKDEFFSAIFCIQQKESDTGLGVNSNIISQRKF